MDDAEIPFGRFSLKIDDEIAFVIPGEDGEFRGIVTEILEKDEGAPALSVYLPDFPHGRCVTVYPEEVTAKIFYSNAGLSRFEIAEKVEYYDDDARRICMAWVYEIDTANREIVVLARGKTFSRFPEELRLIPPPRLSADKAGLCEEQARRDGEEEER